MTCVTDEDSAFLSQVFEQQADNNCVTMFVTFHDDNLDLAISFYDQWGAELEEAVFKSCPENVYYGEAFRAKLPPSAIRFKISAIPRIRDQRRNCVVLKSSISFSVDSSCVYTATCPGKHTMNAPISLPLWSIDTCKQQYKTLCICITDSQENAYIRIFDEKPVHHSVGYTQVLLDVGGICFNQIKSNIECNNANYRTCLYYI